MGKLSEAAIVNSINMCYLQIVMGYQYGSARIILPKPFVM